MTNAQHGPVYWLVLHSFRGWDKFLVNAVCCHATKTISLYHDPILSADCISRLENIGGRRKDGDLKYRFVNSASGRSENIFILSRPIFDDTCIFHP